jgi:hypothetical protein
VSPPCEAHVPATAKAMAEADPDLVIAGAYAPRSVSLAACVALGLRSQDALTPCSRASMPCSAPFLYLSCVDSPVAHRSGCGITTAQTSLGRVGCMTLAVSCRSLHRVARQSRPRGCPPRPLHDVRCGGHLHVQWQKHWCVTGLYVQTSHGRDMRSPCAMPCSVSRQGLM